MEAMLTETPMFPSICPLSSALSNAREDQSPAKEHDENSKILIYIYTIADEGWMSFPSLRRSATFDGDAAVLPKNDPNKSSPIRCRSPQRRNKILSAPQELFHKRQSDERRFIR